MSTFMINYTVEIRPGLILSPESPKGKNEKIYTDFYDKWNLYVDDSLVLTLSQKYDARPDRVLVGSFNLNRNNAFKIDIESIDHYSDRWKADVFIFRSGTKYDRNKPNENLHFKFGYDVPNSRQVGNIITP